MSNMEKMDKNTDQIYTTVMQLSEWVRHEKHLGWDPYDGTTADAFKNNSNPLFLYKPQ